jgi:transcriptional regulator with XRE-family HTH domain
MPESEPASLSFGAALRASRRAAGLSQRELAERTQLDFSYISKLENGRLPPPSADTVLAICRVLGIPAEDLLALTGKIPTQVQQTLSASKTAQRFLLEAQRMGLTDEEWSDLTQSLQRLRGGEP